MTGELFRDQAPRSQPLAAVPGDRHLIDEPSDATTDGSANCEIIPDRVTDCRRRQWLHVNESNPKLLDLQSALAEMQRLREENVRLRCLLHEHGIQIPAVQSTTVIPVATNALPSAHNVLMLARMYARRLKGYNLIGYTIRDASNERSFSQQVENRSSKEPLINGET